MATGTFTSYDLVTGVVVDISPLIRLLSPTEVPLQSGMGSDGNTVLSQDSCFEKKIEWQDDVLLAPRSTISVATTTGDGWIVVAVGDQIKFSTGDALLIGAEQVRVTGYGSTANSLTVTRAYAGTSAGTVALNADVVDLGANLPEGSDPQNSRAGDRSNRFNLTQIFGPTSVVVSGTEQVIRKYGLATTEFDYQGALRTKEEVIKLEQALIMGTRYEDTTNKWRQMGGMAYYIQTNVDSSTTALTETVLLDKIQTIYDLGGDPNRALLGSKQKRVVSAFDSSSIRLGRADVGRGQTVEYFDSDFARIDFVLHRRMRTSELILFSREQATIRTLRPWQFKMLGDTGDSTKGIIVGEKSLMFEAERWAARFSALT